MARADGAQQYCVVQRSQGNERVVFCDIRKPSSVSYSSPCYGRPERRITDKKFYSRQSPSVYRLWEPRRSKVKELCHFCTETGCDKRDWELYLQEKGLSQTLSAVLNCENPSRDSNGKNELAFNALLNAALATNSVGIEEGGFETAAALITEYTEDFPSYEEQEERSDNVASRSEMHDKLILRVSAELRLSDVREKDENCVQHLSSGVRPRRIVSNSRRARSHSAKTLEPPDRSSSCTAFLRSVATLDIMNKSRFQGENQPLPHPTPFWM